MRQDRDQEQYDAHYLGEALSRLTRVINDRLAPPPEQSLIHIVARNLGSDRLLTGASVPAEALKPLTDAINSLSDSILSERAERAAQQQAALPANTDFDRHRDGDLARAVDAIFLEEDQKNLGRWDRDISEVANLPYREGILTPLLADGLDGDPDDDLPIPDGTWNEFTSRLTTDEDGGRDA